MSHHVVDQTASSCTVHIRREEILAHSMAVALDGELGGFLDMKCARVMGGSSLRSGMNRKALSREASAGMGFISGQREARRRRSGLAKGHVIAK